MIYKFEIPGEPTAKERPRHCSSGFIYTPIKTKNYETLVKQIYIIEKGPHFGESYIKIKIIAFFGIPTSKSNKQKLLMQAGTIRPTKKPDLDNITKIICDALNGIAYKDDAQVIELEIKKYYADEPKAMVELESI